MELPNDYPKRDEIVIFGVSSHVYKRTYVFSPIIFIYDTAIGFTRKLIANGDS